MPKPNRYVPYYDDIVAAMAEPGCAFCRLQLRAAERYIDALLWESVNDPRIRRQVAQARGFCNRHAWLLIRPGGALSAAIIYKDVIQAAAQVVRTAPVPKMSLWQRVRALLGRHQPGEDTLVRALTPQQPCPVCTNATEIDAHLCATLLAAQARSDDVLEHYRTSAGLCLEHFRTLLSYAQQPAGRAALIAVQLDLWAALDHELAEFIRKSDHQARGEKFGAERDAWERAIALTSGPQPLSRSQRGGITQSGA
ncbi:MAG TPA: hypothetical protein DCL15_17915 [Chloroflexi bacterium]|nr:hypothetical protein [Chloroflexota bacterium]HHW87258.1 hypothetical protein [Chloroflexota bacterium]